MTGSVMDAKDPYVVLGVSFSATQEEIKVAYRKLVKLYHPDQFGTYMKKVAATQKLREVIAAYEILGDRKRREEYDRSHFQRVPSFVYPKTTTEGNQDPSNLEEFPNWLLTPLVITASLGIFFHFLFYEIDDPFSVFRTGKLIEIAGRLVVLAILLAFSVIPGFLYVSMLFFGFYHAEENLKRFNDLKTEVMICLGSLGIAVLPLFLNKFGLHSLATPFWVIATPFIGIIPAILGELIAILLYLLRSRKVVSLAEALIQVENTQF